MTAKRILFALALCVLPLALASPAWAHYPQITATAACDTATGKFVISYTAYSFTGQILQGENPNIQIGFNDTLVGSGAFVYPTMSFSGSAPAPELAGPGVGVVVTAYAAAPWLDGYPGGQSRSVTVYMPTDPCSSFQPALGRMTGGGKQVTVDYARITKGLTIHCDLLLSNNLEVNWPGNSFHMTEHIETVACIDTPVVQAPPAAPFDTLIGVGTGRWNNTDGYTIEFTFVDVGEPGTADQAGLKIYETANPSHVVLNLPVQVLVGGNLQAHYDQPHK